MPNERPPNDLGSSDSLLGCWRELSSATQRFAFERLPLAEQIRLFSNLSLADQLSLSVHIPKATLALLASKLPELALAEFLRSLSEETRNACLEAIAPSLRSEVEALLTYAENNPIGQRRFRFSKLKPEMTADEAIAYFREQANLQIENIYYAYVLDDDGRLLGIVPFRKLFLSTSKKRVRDIMLTNLVTLTEGASSEETMQVLTTHGFMAIPVVDAANRMRGIVTSEGMLNQVQAEATEDMQKSAGMEALGAPYLSMSVLDMIKKRAGWLLVLFLGETFTASAMGYYEHEIERAVVLALFIPLIISSGGNSGSQASTLIIRAIALHEVKLRDWWRVFLREVLSGLALGAILGAFGILRIIFWPARDRIYGEHYLAIALTVGLSLLGIVLWGSLAGSMLPFLLRRLGFDPASASAPFVATLVDVTGLIIYFSVAKIILGGILL